jgi:hypothetical protein
LALGHSEGNHGWEEESIQSKHQLSPTSSKKLKKIVLVTFQCRLYSATTTWNYLTPHREAPHEGEGQIDLGTCYNSLTLFK